MLLLLFLALPFACGDGEEENEKEDDREMVLIPTDPDYTEFTYNPDYSVCGVTNAIENLEWLNNKLRSLYVYAREYQEQDYILESHNHTTVIGRNIYDCQGERVDEKSDLYKELLRSYYEKDSAWVCIFSAYEQ